jgi:hypothetical protein
MQKILIFLGMVSSFLVASPLGAAPVLVESGLEIENLGRSGKLKKLSYILKNQTVFEIKPKSRRFLKPRRQFTSILAYQNRVYGLDKKGSVWVMLIVKKKRKWVKVARNVKRLYRYRTQLFAVTERSELMIYNGKKETKIWKVAQKGKRVFPLFKKTGDKGVMGLVVDGYRGLLFVKYYNRPPRLYELSRKLSSR